MSEVLFVYGTLMGREKNAAPACIEGELWDLGPFPAAWKAGTPGAGIIHGELMHVVARGLADLDRYEGVAAGFYCRRKVRLVNDAGEPTGAEAWVYEFGRSPAETGRAHKVEGGRWKR